MAVLQMGKGNVQGAFAMLTHFQQFLSELASLAGECVPCCP